MKTEHFSPLRAQRIQNFQEYDSLLRFSKLKDASKLTFRTSLQSMRLPENGATTAKSILFTQKLIFPSTFHR